MILDPATLAAAEKVVRDRAKRCHYASDARRLNNAADAIRDLGITPEEPEPCPNP
jgi:hypothetical protein